MRGICSGSIKRSVAIAWVRAYVSWITAFIFASTLLGQEQVLRKAARLDAEHKCDEAETLYRQASAVPSSFAFLNNLGNHYITCGSPEKARDAYERLLKINPAHHNANLQLARLALTRKDAAVALVYLARLQAGKSTAQDPAVLLVQAEALQQTGNRGAAATVIDRLSKMAANDPPSLFALGIACGRMGFYERAEAAFGSVLLLDPGDFDVLYNLGLAATRAGHDERARNAFESALKARPADAGTLYELGRVESNLRDFNRAVYLLAQAAKLAPERPNVLLALARASQLAGFYGDSLLAYDSYLKLRPDDELVRRDRALLRGYSYDGQAEAVEELKHYVEQHPEDAVGYYDLAQLEERSDRSLALAHVITSVQLDPAFEPAHFFRAWLLKELGREVESIDELRVALRLDPKHARALDLMGLDYLNLEKAAEAEKTLRQAVALSPADPDVLFHLSRALMELGRAEEAKPFLDQFEKVKQQGTRGPREAPGVIESAGLAPAEQLRRVIEQLRQLVANAPADPTLRINLGSALLTQGSVAEGLAVYHELLALNPGGAVSHDAGIALLRFEQYALARDFLERAAVDRPAARLDLAIALFFVSGPAQALAALDQAPADGDQGDGLLLRARILEASGHSAEADAAIEESLQFSVSRPRLAEESALMLLAHGKSSKALDLVEKAIASAPKDAGLALARAVVLSASGRNREAEKAVREVENRWPEWDLAYLVDGLILKRDSQFESAKRKIEIARSLGAKDGLTSCALARMSGFSLQNSSAAACSCRAGVLATFFPPCVGAAR